MELTVQKRLAATLLKCSKKRVRFDPAELESIKEAITKKDLRRLIGDGLVWKVQEKGVSRARANLTLKQKRKGLQKGEGTHKGTANARFSRKTTWIRRIRHQRAFLKELKEAKLIAPTTFTNLYRKAKGGFFRSRRHIKLYLEENNLFEKKVQP
jgi:large subunit ribosomal protein L19e